MNSGFRSNGGLHHQCSWPVKVEAVDTDTDRAYLLRLAYLGANIIRRCGSPAAFQQQVAGEVVAALLAVSGSAAISALEVASVERLRIGKSTPQVVAQKFLSLAGAAINPGSPSAHLLRVDAKLAGQLAALYLVAFSLALLE